jgi:hypothetical protein
LTSGTNENHQFRSTDEYDVISVRKPDQWSIALGELNMVTKKILKHIIPFEYNGKTVSFLERLSSSPHFKVRDVSLSEQTKINPHIINKSKHPLFLSAYRLTNLR